MKRAVKGWQWKRRWEGEWKVKWEGSGKSVERQWKGSGSTREGSEWQLKHKERR